MQTQILLTTLNARYHHSSFGLRYLFANLGVLQSRSRLLEFTISQAPRDIAEAILALEPRIVGFGIYIWNTVQTEEVISILKSVRPGLIIVLGGPEVSHESETQSICRRADFVIRGEADFLFPEFCFAALEKDTLPGVKWITGELPDIRHIVLPYSHYSDEDLRNRVLYVEASRGCPYKCEYCLSSLDKSVRNFDLDRFLKEMSILIERGARQFKFVDRTFNLSMTSSARILQFFLDRMSLGLFIHFELVPDRLPEELRELVRRFPAGALQFEIGIQTWNPEVSRRISRRQDYAKIRENLRFLREQTGVHSHADLIVGLPGETVESFGRGFDILAGLAPDEIQVGILKRLKGTPISRHDREWAMVYQEQPPFQILSTSTMSFEELQRLSRFARFWDLVANSGNFPRTTRMLKDRSAQREDGSFFRQFFELTEYLSSRHPQGHGVALLSLVESIWSYLLGPLQVPAELARETLLGDYTGKVSRDVPGFLRPPKAQPLPAGAARGRPARAGDGLDHLPARQWRARSSP